MRRALAVARVELIRHFSSPSLYLMLFFLSLTSGYFMITLIGRFQELTLQFAANPQATNLHFHERIIAPMTLSIETVFLLLIPLLTMRCVASERVEGTFEWLASSPLRPLELVFGKLLALSGVVFALCLVVAVEPLLLLWQSEPGSAFDFPAYFLTLFGLYLLGLAFASIGLAASALSASPMVAAGSSFFILLLSWVLSGGGASDSEMARLFAQLSPLSHLENFALGRLVLSDLIYFIVVIGVSLVLAYRGVDAHRWSA